MKRVDTFPEFQAFVRYVRSRPLPRHQVAKVLPALVSAVATYADTIQARGSSPAGARSCLVTIKGKEYWVRFSHQFHGVVVIERGTKKHIATFTDQTPAESVDAIFGSL